MKAKKGEFGYRKAHRLRQLAVVFFFIAMILVLLGSRRFIKSAGMRNIVTVGSVLMALPMANTASPMIAAWKIKGMDAGLHDKCVPYEGKFPVLYELTLTSRDFILPIDVAAIHPSGIYLYCPDRAPAHNKAEKYINEMLGKWDLKPNARILTDEAAFLRRLKSLPEIKEGADSEKARAAANLLENLSM